MKKKPYSMIPALAQRTQLGIHTYVLSGGQGVEDYNSHKDGWDIIFPARSCLGGTVDLYGFELTGTDLTVGIDTGRRTIEPSGSNPVATAQDYGMHSLYYKGKAVPFSHFESYTTTGKWFITVAETANYSADAADYVAWYGDWLRAYVMSAEVGGVDLPIEKSGFNGLGIDEEVYQTVKRGDMSASGAFTVAFDLTTQLIDSDTTPNNAAAAEIFSRWYKVDKGYYHTAWDDRKTIIDDYLDDRKGLATPYYASVSLLNRSGKRLDAAQGQVWGVLTTLLDCRITSMDNYANITNDATDPVAFTVNFTTNFPDYVNQVTILTTG